MRHGTILLAACLAAWSPQLCQAQVEVTPFYGYQFSGSFQDEETGEEYDLSGSACVGGLLDVYVSDISQVEFYYSHQETELEAGSPFPTSSFFDMDVDYYHLGGTLLIDDEKWQPFVVGTLGLTHLSPEPSSIRSLTRFSLGFGGGARYFPTKNLGLYLAGRGLYTFIEGDTHIRIESGSTTVRIEANGLWQAVFQAGAIFRF
ncbi:MAG: outer membrane beta-barrel protein [Phycisphaerales bacterium]|nr:MAG: outer membrane beta-barrel protein [Phycisphaerales bacterium]